MLIALIGHRGVGKTCLLKHLKSTPYSCIDLDQVIEEKTGKSIPEIFNQDGEAYFRNLERDTFNEIKNFFTNKKIILALGAGFPLERIPKNNSWKCLWVQRPTDLHPRYFTNRPHVKISLLEREKRYELYANSTLEVPEGLLKLDLSLKQCLNRAFMGLGEQCPFPKTRTPHFSNIFFTLPTSFPDNFPNNIPDSFLATPLAQQKTITFPFSLEIRSDFFPNKFSENIKFFSNNKLLMISLREETLQHTLNKLREVPPLLKKNWILDISLDFLKENIEQALNTLLNLIQEFNLVEFKICFSLHSARKFYLFKKFSLLNYPFVHYLKFSPEVSHFSELIEGEKWRQTSSKKHIFLPRQPHLAYFPQGDLTQPLWQWYRLSVLQNSPFQFVRFGRSKDYSDQPTEYQIYHNRFLNTPLKKRQSMNPSHFGAVLGNPVFQSYSPVFHSQKINKWPYIAIPLSEEQIPVALPFLISRGLRFASITSPLKLAISKISEHPVKLGKNSGIFKSSENHKKPYNTLTIDQKGKIHLNDTDFPALKKIFTPKTGHFILWGGGGLLPSIQKIIPNIVSIPARPSQLDQSALSPEKKSENKFEDKIDIHLEYTLIWAVPFQYTENEIRMPPLNIKINRVIDLNYTQNSLGIKVANQFKAHYVSGLQLFKLQAKHQQIIWKKILVKNRLKTL